MVIEMFQYFPLCVYYLRQVIVGNIINLTFSCFFSMKDATIYYPSRYLILLLIENVAINHLEITFVIISCRYDPQSVEICYADIECLAPEHYLTSPIMNFYIL